MRKHKPAKDEHRNDERIVELMRVPSRFEANVIVARLQSAGIKVMGGQNDGDGIAPHYALVDGHIIYVFEKDVPVARALLAEE